MTVARFVGICVLCAIAAVPALAQAPKISLTTKPSPLLLGQNRFEVDVKTAKGRPIADAEVLVTITMPPRPAVNHPEMRSEAKLKPAGNGKYTGVVMVTMAGAWTAEIVVRSAGKTIGRSHVVLEANERVESASAPPGRH